MSVAYSAKATIVPIARFQSEENNKRLILARWHGNGIISGDGTGGVETISITLPASGEIFGPHTVITLDLLNLTNTAVFVYAIFSIVTPEPSSYPAFPLQTSTTMGFFDATTLGMLLTATRGFYFRLGNSSVATQFSILLSANAIGQNIGMIVGGLVLDERLLP